jgi:hypothetical protein
MAFTASFAQELVTTEPMPRNAVLEEFTGIYCQYCPDGHAIAADLLENNPGRMVVLGVHQGSFANPNGDDPDYRTDFGDALANQADVGGYPAGTVNRHEFDGMQQNGGTAMSRGSWGPATDLILQQMSPVNVGIQTSYEEATRELTVDVELYYTGDAVEASNFITVAITQNHVFGPQTGGGAGDNYEHMHMLRHFVTGQWGDEVSPTTAGTLIERTYTYTLPDAIREVELIPEDCEVAVFVTETTQEIITGDVVHLINGTNLFIGSVISEDSHYMDGTQGEITTFNLEANSNLSGEEDFTFTLSTNAPEDWDGVFVANGDSYDETATLSLSGDTPLPIQLEVTPGATAAMAEYTLTMVSESNPDAPEQQVAFYVISGLSDLLVNGTGGPEAENHQDVYITALDNAGNSTYDVVRGNVFAEAFSAGALQNINNVYYNVAWTFPAFSDAQAQALMSFMDNGGNLFVAGQDIGWDIMSGSGNGTAVTEELYTDYLAAEYINDGSSSNNLLTANEDDENFGWIEDSQVIDAYGGNMYPEEIAPLGDAVNSFFYNSNPSKGAAVYNETETYTSIYFGIGMEMIADQQVVDDIISTINEMWAPSGVNINPVTQNALLGSVYPNPFDNRVSIEVNLTEGMTLMVTDISGRKVYTEQINTNESLININTTRWNSGIYFYQLQGENPSALKKMIKY